MEVVLLSRMPVYNCVTTLKFICLLIASQEVLKLV